MHIVNLTKPVSSPSIKIISSGSAAPSVKKEIEIEIQTGQFVDFNFSLQSGTNVSSGMFKITEAAFWRRASAKISRG